MLLCPGLALRVSPSYSSAFRVNFEHLTFQGRFFFCFPPAEELWPRSQPIIEATDDR
jgi:hypothetical protein